jgi:hypothetical protein
MPFRNNPAIWIKELFIQTDLSRSLSLFLSTVVLVLIIPLLSWFSNLIEKALIPKVFQQTTRDDLFALSKMN